MVDSMMRARDVANEVLRCVREGDIDKLVGLFSAVNRKKIAVLDDKTRERLAKFLEKSKRMQVGELRDGPTFLGPGSIVAKIRQDGDEVFVISLKKEGDKYVFDDIDSPSVDVYNALKKISG
jgi:uncharacterized protein YkuJ